MTRQNTWLVNNIFDPTGNYLHCMTCVCLAFGVNKKRLARLRDLKVKGESNLHGSCGKPSHATKTCCPVAGCTGQGHKNLRRWAEGHTTRAGCPIHHHVAPPDDL